MSKENRLTHFKVKGVNFIIYTFADNKVICRDEDPDNPNGNTSPSIRFSEVENGVIQNIGSEFDDEAKIELAKYLPLYRSAVEKYKKLIVFK